MNYSGYIGDFFIGENNNIVRGYINSSFHMIFQFDIPPELPENCNDETRIKILKT